jgi:D-sedoheptulose 7-phosphate isomerase
MDRQTALPQVVAGIERHIKMAAELQATGVSKIIQAAEMIIQSLKQGGRLYVCGNGGSAADAKHIAGELVGRFLRERKGLPVLALNANDSVITAVANDYGYEAVFARQVEALVRKGDVLWVLSTSGSSANIIAAAELAKKKQVQVLAFTGRKNSKLEQIADLCLCVDSETSPSSQEIHQLAYHIICELVESAVADETIPQKP